MIRCCNDFRLALIALLAIVGTVLSTAEASAGTARSAAPRCCGNRVCPPGCCMRGSNGSRSDAVQQPSAVVTRSAGLTNTAPSCECRAGEPASPAAKPVPASVKTRADQGHGDTVPSGVSAVHPASLGRLVEPLPRPPNSSLDLATVRLII